jgi:hypothetical protein
MTRMKSHFSKTPPGEKIYPDRLPQGSSIPLAEMERLGRLNQPKHVVIEITLDKLPDSLIP